MRLFDVQKGLAFLGLEIFTLEDLVKLTGQKKDLLRNQLSLLTKQNKVFRLKKGYYSFKELDDKFKLQVVYEETYVALHSALEFYESTTQRFNNLDLITRKVKKNHLVNGTNVFLHKVKGDMFFGYKKVLVGDTEILISTIEKTIIDCVYFSENVYLTEVISFIRKYKKEINKELLEMYLKKISSFVLNKRVGYLLEQEGIFLNDLILNNNFEKLTTCKPADGVKNNKWKLIINEEL